MAKRKSGALKNPENLPDIVRFAKALIELDKAQKSDSLTDEKSVAKLDFDMSRNPVRDPKGDAAVRQGSDEDEPFAQGTIAEGLIVPPIWNPWTLYRLFEESDILQACIRAYVDALARSYDFEYDGPKDDRQEKAVLARERKVRDFFRQVNEFQSWLGLMVQKELDYWVTGNSYVEVLEDRETHEPLLMYNIPPTFMRVTPLEEKSVLTWATIRRDGNPRDMPIHRRFRKFARWLPTKKIEWFKQLGDPRVLDRTTGQYLTKTTGEYVLEKDLKSSDYSEVRANSVWWFRDVYGGQTYGIPRWVAAIADIRGLYLSRWVNFDTLDHGGIPPWLLLVYGKLSPGTRKYLKEVIKKWRDPSAFSDPGVLEIEPNLLSFNSSGGAKAGAEFVSMRDMRNEDSMFVKYAENCQTNVGAVFRLAGIHYGRPDAQGGTNDAVIEFTEKNVFEPLRMANDEKYNVELLQAQFGIYDWRLKTKRPPLSGEAFYKALGMAGRTGGPSLNELTRMCNEMFGTNWPEREHWFYRDISAAEAVGMVRSGQVSYNNEDGTPVVHPPAQAGQPQEGEAGGGEPDFSDMKLASDKGKLDSMMPVADAINMLHAFQMLEAQVKGYQPVEKPDPDFKM